MIPAILCNDKIVTGLHHGDAFAKLNENEKNNCVSGFLHNLKFIADNKIVYLKQILLVRHAEAEKNEDGYLTDNGKKQAEKLAKFLIDMDFGNFEMFTSPYIRCKQTSEILQLNCPTNNCLCKKSPTESNEDFQKRINDLLDFLPEKSILITHSDLIQNILAIINLSQPECISNCSITYIHNNRLIWLAKDINAK
jgi:phosphohistidine phosphatase SixA